jgi:hypothetical protein
VRGGDTVRSALRVVTAIVIVPYFSACSFFGPHMQTITVSSDPAGAEVLLNGTRVGETPLRTQVPRRDELLVEVRKPGYETAYRSASRTLSTFGILDVIGGAVILIPFIGLLSPAAWEQDPETFGITLDREPAAQNAAKEKSR